MDTSKLEGVNPVSGLGGVPAVPAVPAIPLAALGPAGALAHSRVPEPPFETRALLQALRRRWVLAVLAGVFAGAASAAAVWSLVPPAKYVARTTLMVSTFLPKIIFDTAEARSDFHTYLRTQMALLKSRFVLSAALRDPNVAALTSVQFEDDQVDWLESAIKIDYRGSAEIIELSLNGDRPADLAALLNAVTDAYMRLVVEEEHRARLARHDDLRKLWGQYQDKLRAKRRSLREVAEAAGSSDRATLALKQQIALENASVAQQALITLRPEMLKAQADVKFLEAKQDEGTLAPAAPVPVAPVAGSALGSHPDGKDDPQIADLRAQIEKLTGQLQHNQRLSRRQSDPSLANVRRALDAARRALATRYAELARAPAPGGIGAAPGAIASPLTQARERLQVLKLYEDALKSDVGRFQEETRTTTLRSLDLQTEQDEMMLADMTAKKIGTEIEALDVELQAPPRIKVIDRAQVPRTKDEKRKIKLTMAAGAGAFAIGLLGVTLWEYRSRRISSLDEVVHGLGMRLVGTLPAHPVRARRLSGPAGSDREDRWRNRLIESIDATRTLLLHLSRTESIRVVMVTSALQGEGKTSLAGHLATSLVRAGRRTLLIDCDLRRPSVQRLFEVPLEPGLCELLRGEADIREVIRPTAGSLSVITAGSCDALALQALAQEGARLIFDSLLKEYDFLIVDSAPVLPVADSLLLSQQVDAVIFSLLHDVSCLPQVRAAYERLMVLGVRLLGAVVNGTEGRAQGYSRYSYYQNQANG
jgi:capsular exopolysaccharide synthesis family protein